MGPRWPYIAHLSARCFESVGFLGQVKFKVDFQDGGCGSHLWFLIGTVIGIFNLRIRYARACSNYQDFMEHGKVLSTKFLSQGYQKTKLVATLKKTSWETSWSGQSLQCGSFQNCFWCLCQWRAISRLPKSRTYTSTDISFVQAYGHGGRSLLTK